VLLGEAATELALKRQPLDQYRVLHFAVHGILSTKSPTRSALLLRPASPEDGLLQAWEILSFKLRASLVTLSLSTIHANSAEQALARLAS
jgi:CHAT domain-containing protein